MNLLISLLVLLLSSCVTLKPSKDCPLVSINGQPPEPVCYQQKGKLKMFQGDIILSEDRISGLISDTLYLQSHTWANGVIPYVISPNLKAQPRIIAAAADYQAKTKIRLVPRTNEPDYLLFEDASDCSSYIGRQGGAQSVHLNANCDLAGTIHEIAHAAGLWHEQCRRDRDSYINIYWENMDPSMRYNFEMNPGASQEVGPYDYKSVMHYPPYGFSINGKPTITRKDGSTDLGNSTGLSAGDVASVGAIYGGGPPPPPPPPPPPSSGFTGSIFWRLNVGARNVTKWTVQNGSISSMNIADSSDGNFDIAGSGDFVGTGEPGIIFRQRNGQGLLTFWQLSQGKIVASHVLSASTVPSYKIAGVGDFNGDGKTDIVWRNMAPPYDLTVWLMDRTKIQTSVVLAQNTSPGYELAAIVDINQDGKDDLFWRNTGGNREVYVWLMNGTVGIKSILLAGSTDGRYLLLGGAFSNGKPSLVWRDLGAPFDMPLWNYDSMTNTGTVLAPSTDGNWSAYLGTLGHR